MNRWIVVVVVVAVVACKKPESACPAAKKEAAAAVEEAFFSAKLEVDKAKLEEEKATVVAPGIRTEEKDLEVNLKLFEQSMDCLVKVDCCARLPKMSYEGRTQVSRAAFGLKSQQEQVQAIVAPLIKHLEGDSLLADDKADPKSVTAWCTSARELVANIRRDAPAGWKAAIADADKATAAAHAVVVTQEQRLAKVREWAGALTKSKSAATPPELSSGGDSALEHAREAVARYQKCD